jgi:hypothetical protein
MRRAIEIKERIESFRDFFNGRASGTGTGYAQRGRPPGVEDGPGARRHVPGSLKTKITALNKYLLQCSQNVTAEIEKSWAREDGATVVCELLYGDDSRTRCYHVSACEFVATARRMDTYLLRVRAFNGKLC